MLGQRFVPVLTGEYPLPGQCCGEAIQQLPHRLAEQNVPRPVFPSNQGRAVGLDLATVQASYLARAACARSAGLGALR